MSGCTSSLSGGPQRVFPVETQLSFVRKTFGPPDFNAYLARPTGDRKAYRNEYVLAQMFAIDVNYDIYEAGLTREMQGVNFAAAVANIALTSVAAQISPPGTKDILAATAAGLTGVKASYDKDILLQRTIQIIQSQMRASRARVAARILARLNRSAEEYPLMLAWIDLQAYYKAGTFTDGLVEAGQSIGSDAIISGEVRDFVVVEGLSTSSPQFVTFSEFIFNGGDPATAAIDNQRYAYLNSLLSNGGEVIMYFSDNNPAHEPIRQKILACIQVYQTAQQCKPRSIIVS